MANAKKCDICGKFYETYTTVTINDEFTVSGCQLKFASNDGIVCTVVDLCPECMTKVHTLFYDISSEKGT